MFRFERVKFQLDVALRKESVDRNDVLAVSAALQLMSLSARRAWIEISLNYKEVLPWVVSPQGERG